MSLAFIALYAWQFFFFLTAFFSPQIITCIDKDDADTWAIATFFEAA